VYYDSLNKYVIGFKTWSIHENFLFFKILKKMFLLTAKDARKIADLIKRNKRPQWAKTLRNYPIICNNENDVLWNALNREDYANFYFSDYHLVCFNKMNLKKGYEYVSGDKYKIVKDNLNEHIYDLDTYFAKNIKWSVNNRGYSVKFPFYKGSYTGDKMFFKTFLELYGYKIEFFEEGYETYVKLEW